MDTFESLILAAEIRIEQLTKDQERALAEVRAIHSRAKAESRGLTEDENRDVAASMNRHEARGADLTKARSDLASLREAKAAEERATAHLNERHSDPSTQDARKPAYDQVARIGQEKRTYNEGDDKRKTGQQFIRDVAANFLFREPDAEQRLLAHMREERVERGQYLSRAVGTGAFAGLTVPQYLTEMYAPAVAARRPFADAMTALPLPAQGMTVNISRITTPSGTALQASENTAVQNTDMDDTLLTENVQTAAGQQTISRQAIERGTGVEATVMNDLQRRLATTLDSTIINQATTGLTNISTAVAYTDASPTGPELYPKILAASAGSEAALLGEATPDLVVMHGRRWYWLQSQMTTSWPMIGQPGMAPQNIGVNYVERYGSGARGLLPNGQIVIVDNNIATNLGAGTNEDEIYVVPSEESYLWEDPDAPQFIRAEQTAAASLGVLLVLYTYFAYTMRRYSNSHQKIGGTGLITPTF